MNWKLAFVLLLTIEVVFSAPLSPDKTFDNLEALGSCFVKCYMESVWRDILCADLDGKKLTIPNKSYHCMKAKCRGGELMEYLYMGWCGHPIPSTGHIFTEPKIPSPYPPSV